MIMSKINYSLQVINDIWDIEPYRDKPRRFHTFTKYDLRQLQKLQNCALRLQLGIRDCMTPTRQLLMLAYTMSIHQTMAHIVLNQAKRLITTKQPRFLYSKITASNIRNGKIRYKIPTNKLNLSDEGFLYKALTLLNMIPPELQNITDLRIFKSRSKTWIRQNISQKPY